MLDEPAGMARVGPGTRMGSKLLWTYKSIPPAIGMVLVTAASISPPEVTSHLAAWWELSGYKAPVWLKTPVADHTALWIAPVVIGLYFLGLFVLSLRSKDQKEERAMAGDDNRKGFFNNAPNHGTQTYVEGPQQFEVTQGVLERLAQDLRAAMSAENLPLRVQVFADFSVGRTVHRFLLNNGFAVERYSEAYSGMVGVPHRNALTIVKFDGALYLIIDGTKPS